MKRPNGATILAIALLGWAAGCISPPGSTCSQLGGFACSAASQQGFLPVRPSLGALYEQYKAPLQTNVKDTTLGSKVGRATVNHIRDPLFTQLPLVTYGEVTGDAAVNFAAEKAGITEIHLIEVERLSVLGIFVQTTVIVHGD